jgi:MFS family permease
LQWIVDAYVLVFAALLLTMGAIGDRLGRKRALQFGLVMFGLGSLWAALANSTEMLIAARAFLGIGGAAALVVGIDLIGEPRQIVLAPGTAQRHVQHFGRQAQVFRALDVAQHQLG